MRQAGPGNLTGTARAGAVPQTDQKNIDFITCPDNLRIMIRFTNFLFVPANRPDRIEKALSSEADLVCMDLEDSVPVAEKDSARAIALETLAQIASPRLALRINGLATRAGLADR